MNLDDRPLKRPRLSHDYENNVTSNGISPPLPSSQPLSPSPSSDRVAGVRIPVPHYPRSAFTTDQPSELPHLTEVHALSFLLAHDNQNPALPPKQGYTAIDLCDFEFYRPGSRSKHRLTLASLHHLNVVVGDKVYELDGELRFGRRSCRVERIPIDILSIDGYGNDRSSIDHVFVQSCRLAGSDIWYRLRQPATRYVLYHQPFLWVANFAKLFVDFLDAKENVTLHDFRQNFHSWLLATFTRQDTHLRSWSEAYRRQDYRQVVAANFEFLWKEASNVIGEAARQHFIWKEVDVKQLSAIPAQKVRETKTVVTRYAYECFKNSYFASSLKLGEIDQPVLMKQHARADLLGLCVEPPVQAPPVQPGPCRPKRDRTISIGIDIGDVVSIDRDADGHWHDEADEWFAYVQDVRQDKKGRQYLGLIWLYRPSDTVLSNAEYQFPQELFMSDHCNCHDPKVFQSDIIRKVDVNLFAKSQDIRHMSKHFIRFTYITPELETGRDAAFITLAKKHLRCGHHQPATIPKHERVQSNYPPGTTVLISLGVSESHSDYDSDYEPGSSQYLQGDTGLLEPAVVIEHINKNAVKVLRLIRRPTLDPDAKANELLWSEDTMDVHQSQIVRGCRVRVYRTEALKEERVPAPYAYGGTADCWCLTGLRREVGGRSIIVPVDINNPPRFRQGFDPAETKPEKALSALSLFSGGGSFDRGLEEGGAVKTRWAVELESGPLHTYRANLDGSVDTQLYLGSVNDYTKRAMAGKVSKLIAVIGAVQLLCGGSPCKGFSIANQDRGSEAAKGYSSLVASLIALISLYCPEYAVLENVLTMAGGTGLNKKSSVFEQVMCALVGMGYQVQTFTCDAWTYGSAQERSRLIITIAAPGLTPLEEPPHTHAHPPRTRQRCLGRTKSKVPFGMRSMPAWTPFPRVTAQEAIGDLGDISDGTIRTCIRHPDHRAVLHYDGYRRNVMRCIPKYPYGQGFVDARKAGLIPRAVLAGFANRSKEVLSATSKAFTRRRPDGLLPTVRTNVDPDDSRHGKCVHWEYDRAWTVMEGRRAQSIPDNEVLIGLAREQMMVVGNGVDRKVAVALGMSLREAWLSEATQRHLKATAEAEASIVQAGKKEEAGFTIFEDGQGWSNTPESRQTSEEELRWVDSSEPTPPTRASSPDTTLDSPAGYSWGDSSGRSVPEPRQRRVEEARQEYGELEDTIVLR